MFTLANDFIGHLSGVTKVELTSRIWNELVAWYPEQFKGAFPNKLDEAQLQAASLLYYGIVKSYLLSYNIPVLIETLTAGYLWGVDNLDKYGLENAPAKVKHAVALMKKDLSAQAAQLEMNLKL